MENSGRATVTPIEQLRRSPTASLFEGGETVDVSIFVTAYSVVRVPRCTFIPIPRCS